MHRRSSAFCVVALIAITTLATLMPLVSGGLPHIVVMDAGDRGILGQTNSFSQTQSGWQDYSLAFNSKERTSAILVSLQRGRCRESLCPIFGSLWLDNFSLKQL